MSCVCVCVGWGSVRVEIFGYWRDKERRRIKERRRVKEDKERE